MRQDLTTADAVELLDSLDGFGIIFEDEDLVRQTLADRGWDDPVILASREQHIKDAVTLVQQIRDYGNGITEEKLTGLWSEHSDVEVAEALDKLAFVTDWIGLS
jgi:hypothetical protein